MRGLADRSGSLADGSEGFAHKIERSGNRSEGLAKRNGGMGLLAMGPGPADWPGLSEDSPKRVGRPGLSP